MFVSPDINPYSIISADRRDSLFHTMNSSRRI